MYCLLCALDGVCSDYFWFSNNLRAFLFVTYFGGDSCESALFSFTCITFGKIIYETAFDWRDLSFKARIEGSNYKVKALLCTNF